VKTQGVDSFFLYLNDDLIDLDKEFTVVINDKASNQKLARSFREMQERLLLRRDLGVHLPRGLPRHRAQGGTAEG
jgi:hypothetical protein